MSEYNSEQPTVYTLHEVGEFPNRTQQRDGHLGLSRVFFITPPPDPDMEVVKTIGRRWGVLVRRVTRDDHSMVFEASIKEQTTESVDRLETTIQNIGKFINAAVDANYVYALYPDTESEA